MSEPRQGDDAALFHVEAFTDAYTGQRVVRYSEPSVDHRRGPGPRPRATPSRHTAVSSADPAQVALVRPWVLRQPAGRRWCIGTAREELGLTSLTARALGGIVSGLAAEGLIREAGYGVSPTPSRRGSRVIFWTRAE